MTDEGRLDREELVHRLAPYRCRLICELASNPCVELWESGWREPFTLSPENGQYDEWQWRRVQFLIQKTLPPGWWR
ncbi:MAG TPA: hypothetical protein VGL35_08265 [Rhizomicrobium sp.]|jgi:hypothetical protein